MKIIYLKIVFLLAIIIMLTGCSKSGAYSILITSDVAYEANPLNELPGHYNKKRIVIPGSVLKMSDNLKKKWNDTLNYFNVHSIDTTVKISILDEYGSVKIRASACRNQALAIVVHDASEVTKKGKYIDLKLRYVCKGDDANMVWAATHDYKINNTDECYDGFHSIEYQFALQNILKDKENQDLKNVFVVCAKD